MSDLRKKMSDNIPTKILTTRDLNNSLRAFETTEATLVNSNSNSNNNNNTKTLQNGMVFSSIPLDGGPALIIKQPQLIPAATTKTSQQQHQQLKISNIAANRLRAAATTAITSETANAINHTGGSNLSSILAAATKATIINSSHNNNTSTTHGNSRNKMSATSKYVLLHQSNGQYTTYESAAQAGSTGGNIVIVATEHLDLNGNNNNGMEQQQQIIATTSTTNGENDEELRSLAWLNDSNLIKGIVTTTAGGTVINHHKNLTTLNGKRTLNTSSSVCIMNANNAQDLIEELPQHVASEEHVATTITNSDNQNDLNPETQITTLNVNDFQQQFITSNKRFGGIITTANNGSSNKNNNNSITVTSGSRNETEANALASNAISPAETQDRLDSVTNPHRTCNNFSGAIGATTTVHVGPSGTTTVVEYKSNTNFVPTPRHLLNSSINNNIIVTAANLSSNSNYVPSFTTATTNANYNHNLAIYSPTLNTTSTSTPTSITVITEKPTTTATLITPVAHGNNLSNGVNSNSNNNTVANGSNITNTANQEQKSQQSGSTTHHPHKKYLREKMNVLDHGGGGSINNSFAGNNTNQNSSSNNNNAINSSISIVASPASSHNSFSSSSSTSSTAAVNGGNSPVSKPFYGACATNVSNTHQTSSSADSSPMRERNNTLNNSTSSLASSCSIGSAASSSIHAGSGAYTIINHQQHIASSSPANMSSPEPAVVKDYYALATQQQYHQQQLHQHQQQQNSLRSPRSYSSYDNDSLNNFEVCNTSSLSSRNSSTAVQQHQHTLLNSSNSSNKSHSSSSSLSHSTTPQKQKHPNNVPYDPLVHTNNKPPYSFSSLIFMAIEGSQEKALPVKEIYAWIVQHFPYFKTAPTGWKNSVRHNLSLNKSFVKVEKAPNMGKGSLWRVEPQQRQNLMSALTRSPFFPNSAVDKMTHKNGISAGTDTASGNTSYDSVDCSSSKSNATAAHINQRFDPQLFPNVTKALKDMSEQNILSDVVGDNVDDEIPSDYSTNNHVNHNSSNKINKPSFGGNGCGLLLGPFGNYESIERLARDCGAESIDDVNAATAMLALKHGPKVFGETFQNGAPVITSSPSEDHTYSAGGGSNNCSGASSPLTNGNSVMLPESVFINAQQMPQISCDNQSNCASSDAAYESSDENHNITPEERENQKRHRDGVDALLSLSLSSIVDARTPQKRAAYSNVDENSREAPFIRSTEVVRTAVGKIALLSNAATIAAANNGGVGVSSLYLQHSSPAQHQIVHQHLTSLDEGYNTSSLINENNHLSPQSHSTPHHQQPHQHNLHHAPTPTKKSKSPRSLRNKIKRKGWMR